VLRLGPMARKGGQDAGSGRCPNCGDARIKISNQWLVESAPAQKLCHFYAVCRSCHAAIWRHGDPDDPRPPIWCMPPAYCNCAHDRND